MISFAFIGLGAMGSGMAANLTRSGARVAAFDISASALERARAAGCDSPRKSSSFVPVD
jgi:3-hydroxyisobutyrate dehydrogenase